MTVRELREKYLRFFESKGHDVFPSGSLVPFDVTGRLDESLLFNGAGMVQFKPYFRGTARPQNPRLTTAQKCVRTGDIEEVGDESHLTFFEMLGNFSFGDYFKAEAIAYSWEFLTSPQWLGLDPRKLSFTVFQEDEEALNLWSTHLRAAGIDPATRIFRLGEDTNYWPAGSFSAGPPGPCGPNSEMFYWTAPGEPPTDGYTREDWLRDDDAKNWLEIWNDVFIQFEWQGELKNPDRPSDGYRKTGMPNLPFQSIDTGMGLERTAAVLGGFKSVYDTDAFTPILRTIRELEGPAAGEVESKVRARRIIADHIRTACFCIADGILPSNNGRGYVLRRLIRRAVLKGQRTLGFQDPFFHRVYEGVVEAMGAHYTELAERRDVIVETLRNEEALFRRTVDRGSELLGEWLAALGAGTKDGTLRVLGGTSAFMLYDTYGFPLEVTQEICAEAGVEVDLEGYEAALREAQERSRGGQERETVYGGVGITLQFEEEAVRAGTLFTGYEEMAAQATIRGVIPAVDADGHATGELAIALDQTPFYAQSGGQVSDTGIVQGEGFEFRVLDVGKQDGVVVHLVEPLALDVTVPLVGTPVDELTGLLNRRLYGQPVIAAVDASRRRDIMRNHTATHLLHAALRHVLGTHVTQAGSFVGPDYLRFDFTHGKAMTPDELAEVERIVNVKTLDNEPVFTYVDLPLADAKRMGAMALFGEKYADRVRMVQIGSEPPERASFSRELCGGTHVGATGEIGLFRIVSESSAASGIRRIEAVTGRGAYELAHDESRRLREGAALLKAAPRDLVSAIERTLEQQRELKTRLERLRTQGAAAGTATQVAEISGVELATEFIEDGEAKDASLVADRLAHDKPNRVVLVAATGGGKVTFVAKVGPEALKRGAHAGNLVREVAKRAGGGGGGRPDFATAGGKDPAQAKSALEAAPSLLAEMLGDK